MLIVIQKTKSKYKTTIKNIEKGIRREQKRKPICLVFFVLRPCSLLLPPSQHMTKFQKYKLYLATIIRYYFTQKPKLTWLILLSVFVFIWISLIVHTIMANPVFSAERSGLVRLGNDGLGLLVLFIKPIFVYIAGLIILKKVERQ